MGKEGPARLRDPIPEEEISEGEVERGDTEEVLPCSELGFRDESVGEDAEEL